LDKLSIEKYTGPTLEDIPSMNFSYSYRVELKTKEYAFFSTLKLEFNKFGLTIALSAILTLLIKVVLK
tara:strand:+ start:477 stop:680 length:204 start_codon:yes stop_codon:yes gene_type:complete